MTNYDYQTSDGARQFFEIETLEQLKRNETKYKTIMDALYGGWVQYAYNKHPDLTKILDAYPEIKPHVIHQLYRQEKDFIPKDYYGSGCGSDGYRINLANNARLPV